MAKRILLKGGEVAIGLGVFDGDIAFEGGKIIAVEDRGTINGDFDEVIDCSGKLIMPGLIDVHVHLREPGQAYKEDWETGSSAALAGGVTTVFDMPNNTPPIFAIKDLKAKRRLIEGRSHVNYGLYMGFSGDNLKEINDAKGICAVKFYACNSTGDLGVNEGVEALFRDSNKLIVVHAEDQSIIDENSKRYLADFKGREEEAPTNLHSKIRSVEAAAKSVKAICELAKKYESRVHIAHLSSDAELEVINEYKEQGVKVTCEVAPHHLFLCVDDYEHLGNFARMNPPVRERSDIFSMWKGLKFGEIDIIATDHAPHAIIEKEEPYIKAPSGVPELDTLMPFLMNAVNDEGLTVAEVVKFAAEGPADLFGVKNKGKLEEGYDADIVVVDMDLSKKVEKENLFTKCGWSPYEGSTLKGWPVMVFVNGELSFKDGKVLGNPNGKEVEFV
jgi:dihydroorotase